MKKINKFFTNSARFAGVVLFLLSFACFQTVSAQDSTAKAKHVPEKNTFDGSFIIDNHTCMVPVKKTFEFDIQHRFGTINNGYSDIYGINNPSAISFGFGYTPINNVSLGVGFYSYNLNWNLSAKVALARQAKGGWPISVTFYGNMAVDTRAKENFVTDDDRMSYFSQLIIARKITKSFSVQVAPSLSYFNNVEGYIDANGVIQPLMSNSHIACAFSGRYKLTPVTSLMFNYDQPITEHFSNNPRPNISFGFDFGTSGHSFQLFLSNYGSILPQANNMYNQNDYAMSRYLIGFNITRQWNY
jgi:hypothetical protein